MGIEPTELAGGVGGAGAAGAAGAAGGVGTGGRGAGAGGDVSGGNGGVGAIAGSAGGATGGFGDGGGAAGDGGIGGTDACSPRFAEESLTSAQLDAITCDDANTDACDGCDCGRARRYLSLDLGDKGTFTVLNDVGAGKTLELWMRQREPGPGIVVTAGVLQLDLTANGIPRCTKSGDEHASPTSARENSWTHVACIAAEGKLTIYVDGIDVAWVSVGEYVTLSPQGIAPVGDVAVEVDEIRYSNVVRYAGSFDPPQRFASDEHTAALWHLDEGTSTAFDSADNRTLRLPADALWGTDDCYDGRFP